MNVPQSKLDEFDSQFEVQLRLAFPKQFPWLFIRMGQEEFQIIDINKEPNPKLLELKNHNNFNHEYERDYEVKFINDNGDEKELIFTNWVYFNFPETENRYSIEILDPYKRVFRNHMDVVHGHTQNLEIPHLNSKDHHFFKSNAASEISTNLNKVKYDDFNSSLWAMDIERDISESAKLIGETSILNNYTFKPEGKYHKEIGKSVFPYKPSNYDVKFFRTITYYAFNSTAVWDKCAFMITKLLNLDIPINQRYFLNVMKKLEETRKDAIDIAEYEWLKSFSEKEYPIIAKIRNANAHGQNIESTFLDSYLKGVTKKGKISNLIDWRDGYLKTIQHQQKLMILGIEKCIGLVQQLGEPNPYTTS